MAAAAVSAEETKAEETKSDVADDNEESKAKEQKKPVAAKGVQGLWKLGKGRRAKKIAKAENQGKKIAPGMIRVQVDLDELEVPKNAQLIIPDKKNLKTFKVAVTPDAGFWKGATYHFNFVFPDEYPYKPPKVTCDNKIYHPNIDLQGNVCLNLLKADWRPILTTQQIIHGLIFLFLEPNPSDPLNQEAAEVFRNNINVFRQNVNQSLAGGYVGGTQFPRMNLKK